MNEIVNSVLTRHVCKIKRDACTVVFGRFIGFRIS
jgi:hypothetical protein